MRCRKEGQNRLVQRLSRFSQLAEQTGEKFMQMKDLSTYQTAQFRHLHGRVCKDTSKGSLRALEGEGQPICYANLGEQRVPPCWMAMSV